ncbi:MAG: tetratricopeptide repeat protein [Gemmatimonadota bacterium]|jgi:hypothetical protein
MVDHPPHEPSAVRSTRDESARPPPPAPSPGLLARLKRALTRPWWSEPAAERERRWQRLVLRGPVGGLVGVLFGALSVRAWGAPALPLVGSAGAFGFLLMYLLGQLESWLQALPAEGRGPPRRLVHIAADLVGGGLLGWAMSVALDADGAASLAAGATFLVVYTRVVSRLLWGDAVEGTVRFFSGHRAGRWEPDYSREASLAARGRVDDALASLEEASRERPEQPEPLLRGAWLLREEGRWEEAIEWYRRAFWTPRLGAARAAAIVRHIHEIASERLDDAELARPDARELLARYPDAEEVAWARRELG